MKKIENSFYEYFNTIIHTKIFEKLNLFIKNNVWIVPIIYFIGTIALIIRDKEYGLPFSPISLIQFAVIVVYVGIFLIMYTCIEYSNIQLIEFFKRIVKKKKNIIFQMIVQIIVHIVVMLIILSIFLFILGNMERTLLICISYYIVFPIIIMLIDSKYKSSNLIIIIFYITLILEIPISLGGFKGQEVLYHNISDNTENEYVYYGNYDGLYQFSDNDNIYLIPIDSGYIIYHKSNK